MPIDKDPIPNVEENFIEIGFGFTGFPCVPSFHKPIETTVNFAYVTASVLGNLATNVGEQVSDRARLIGNIVGKIASR